MNYKRDSVLSQWAHGTTIKSTLREKDGMGPLYTHHFLSAFFKIEFKPQFSGFFSECICVYRKHSNFSMMLSWLSTGSFLTEWL